ncbi:hypothetical protein Tco_0752538 [Tanacetum coccineum]|uniref:Uncharacterized protein n=1 Tax=Tanacetum coccineum TaxID=301880 RepID=A0ABQ4Z824_9ASTR
MTQMIMAREEAARLFQLLPLRSPSVKHPPLILTIMIMMEMTKEPLVFISDLPSIDGSHAPSRSGYPKNDETVAFGFDKYDSISSKDDNNDSDSSIEMSSTSRFMREVDVRGVDSDHVDSFEEGEIIGDSVPLIMMGGVKDNYRLRFEGVTDWHQSQGYREPVTMSSATSDVTYTSVYTDSEPGRAFWGADDEEISEGGIPRVIVLGYDGLPLPPVAPPSPDYIPGPEDPQTPPVPQDEDERGPMFIQARDPDYVPEPIYPEYIPLEDDHEFPAEEQPLPPTDSPTAESPGYVTESDPEEDPEEYEDDETEDGPVDYPMDGGDDVTFRIFRPRPSPSLRPKDHPLNHTMFP